jgi:hypothetical protein
MHDRITLQKCAIALLMGPIASLYVSIYFIRDEVKKQVERKEREIRQVSSNHITDFYLRKQQEEINDPLEDYYNTISAS